MAANDIIAGTFYYITNKTKVEALTIPFRGRRLWNKIVDLNPVLSEIENQSLFKRK